MHSSGRGEESPEAYRGGVHPTGQSPYGEQVQPAGGSPWGSPVPGAPEPAEATQMLPPYPAGLPVPDGAGDPGGPPPVADATQMLPPYPGDNPALPQLAGGPAPVPPLPPAPPQIPQSRPQTPPPAEATQALPLSVFHDEQPYEQQGYGSQAQQPQQEQQGYEQAGYDLQKPYQQQGYDQQYGQPQQNVPQYGDGQEHGGYDQAPAATEPQHDSDYDHLFRSDVPGPPPLRQRIIAPPPAQQQGAQPYGQGGGQQPPYGRQPGGHEPAYGYDDGAGRGGRRMSPKVLIGIVVAGCVVAGLVVGGLMSSGGGGGTSNTADKNPASVAPSATASASAPAATGDDAAVKQQAQALDTLLNTSGTSRSAVVSAVSSVRNCDDLDNAGNSLRSASTQRTGLVTQLGSLQVDKLSDHAALSDALTKAWQASAAADGHYANWADQAKQNGVCKGGHARNTDETAAGDRESGTATRQKKRAVKLWNSIAEKYGLTKRQYSQL